MIYNIHYDICALVISLFSIIIVIFRKGIRNKQNIILFVMILAAFLASFFDMPFSIVKLDKSILWKAAENERAGIILSNLIRMVNDMHMKTVAEGVETEEQKNTLKELGCDYLQGYYFSQAIQEEAFCKYCKEYNRIG